MSVMMEQATRADWWERRIPLEGRITAIADNFDALTTQRVYKPAYDVRPCQRPRC